MVSSDADLKELLDGEVFDFHFNCGYNKTMDDRVMLINAIWHHYAYSGALRITIATLTKINLSYKRLLDLHL